MKYNQYVLGAMICLLTLPLVSHALSFAPDAVFLDATTPEECTGLGGSYIEWYGETYCTEADEPSVTIIPEPTDFETQTAEAIDALALIDVVGIREKIAAANVAAIHLPFRVVERDGQPLAVTMDYVPGRVNAHVVNGVVNGYIVEGSAERFGFAPVVSEPLPPIAPTSPIDPSPIPAPVPEPEPEDEIIEVVAVPEAAAEPVVIDFPTSTSWFSRLLTWLKFW